MPPRLWLLLMPHFQKAWGPGPGAAPASQGLRQPGQVEEDRNYFLASVKSAFRIIGLKEGLFFLCDRREMEMHGAGLAWRGVRSWGRSSSSSARLFVPLEFLVDTGPPAFVPNLGLCY